MHKVTSTFVILDQTLRKKRQENKGACVYVCVQNIKKTYPLCVKIFNSFGYSKQDSAGLSFREKFLSKNFIQ